MLQIENTLISDLLIEKKFICDLKSCKGKCCVKGDSGAPVTQDEILILEEIFDKIKPYLRPEGIKEIEDKGKYYTDIEHDSVTQLINGGECAYSVFTEEGVAQCGIEKAYLDGIVSFRKPISCYLYPVRIKNGALYDSVNYDEWDICKPAIKLGEKEKTPVFRFLKNPLIKKYGEEWYEQLDFYATNYKKI